MKSSSSPRFRGWRGVCLVAITYVYFLIFAQFAFLRRLAELGIAGQHLKAVMAAMAVAGIFISIFAPRSRLLATPHLRLRAAFAACAAAALLALLPLTLAAAIAVSFAIGAALGLLTVTLVTHLGAWLGKRHPILQVGLGTGLGYLICNFPPLFTAPPQVQSLVAAILCLSGIFIVSRIVQASEEDTEEYYGKLSPELSTASSTAPSRRLSFASVLAAFTALIWLDSAAFFIIQNTPALKAGTWEGTAHLWATGALHLLAALGCAVLLRRRNLSNVLVVAFVALAAACLLLLHPDALLLASVFYPIGVSVYSVALVAYPSLLSPASSIAERGRQAGWIYAIAGWFGSAMGIGMAQNLGRVPPIFVLFAGAVILTPAAVDLFRLRRRETLVASAVLFAAFCIHRAIVSAQPSHPALTPVELGRQVYISEGCINCHSQYVRPHSNDVTMWGPVQTLAELRREHPPLIGNRRQGPDLAEVGSRRSPLWMKAHFFNPSQVSYNSFMPSYAYLFQNSNRGNDLIAYLQTLRGSGVASQRLQEQSWRPSSEAFAKATVSGGAKLYNDYCATCHNTNGKTRVAWFADFRRLPPDLATGPILDIPPSNSPRQRFFTLARIAKFGIPGTDMPGHEYLSDRDIASLGLWLDSILPQQTQPASKPIPTGEK